MLLVIGGTGKVGRHLVQQLRGEGTPVRMLVRDPARATELEALGAELVTGDLREPQSLDRAMAGVDRVFLLSPPDERQSELQEAAIDAARRGGVRRLVKLSVVAADERSPFPLLRWHGETDAYLRGTGLDWTILQPQSFMHNVLAFAPVVAAEGRFYAPDTGRVPVVHPRDVAAVAARALTDAGHEGRTYYVTGPEPLSLGDMAASLGAALGRDVAWVNVPASAAAEAMAGIGMPGWLVESLLGLYAMGARGEQLSVSPVTREVGRIEPTTYDAFAREVAPILHSAVSAPAVPHRT